MSHYWFLSDSHIFTNVVPNDPAAAYSWLRIAVAFTSGGLAFRAPEAGL